MGRFSVMKFLSTENRPDVILVIDLNPGFVELWRRNDFDDSDAVGGGLTICTEPRPMTEKKLRRLLALPSANSQKTLKQCRRKGSYTRFFCVIGRMVPYIWSVLPLRLFAGKLYELYPKH